MKPEEFLNDDDISLIGRLLNYVLVEDPVFDSELYRTLNGLKMSAAVQRIGAWPGMELTEEDDKTSVSGTIASLVNFPHRSWERIERNVGVSEEKARRLLKLIRASDKTKNA